MCVFSSLMTSLLCLLSEKVFIEFFDFYFYLSARQWSFLVLSFSLSLFRHFLFRKNQQTYSQEPSSRRCSYYDLQITTALYHEKKFLFVFFSIFAIDVCVYVYLDDIFQLLRFMTLFNVSFFSSISFHALHISFRFFYITQYILLLLFCV